MRSGAAGAEDSDYHHDDDGDHSNRHDDHQEHVAVQGRSGTSVGTVTACEGLRREKGVIGHRKKSLSKAGSAHPRPLQSPRVEEGGRCFVRQDFKEVLAYFFCHLPVVFLDDC